MLLVVDGVICCASLDVHRLLWIQGITANMLVRAAAARRATVEHNHTPAGCCAHSGRGPADGVSAAAG